MAELTDDDILETADQLMKDLALTGDDRDVIILRLQRMVWPPSMWPFLHDGEHVSRDVLKRAEGGGWQGTLRCPHGCARRWTVNLAPTAEAVHGALEAAHKEYRTGKPTAVPAPGPGARLILDDLLGRSEYVEVTDERLTGVEG